MTAPSSKVFARFLADVLAPLDAEIKDAAKKIDDSVTIAAAIAAAADRMTNRPRIARVDVAYDALGRITAVTPIYQDAANG